jgi:hypothetical protein
MSWRQVSPKRSSGKTLPLRKQLWSPVLHLTGNLNYYIGAQIAKTDMSGPSAEFNDPNPPSKEEAFDSP